MDNTNISHNKKYNNDILLANLETFENNFGRGFLFETNKKLKNTIENDKQKKFNASSKSDNVLNYIDFIQFTMEYY